MKALLASITILAIAGCSVFQEDTSGLVEDTDLTIYAVAHQSRKPGYWKDRL